MNKQKLLQTTTTGISNLQLNEIGNAYLHKRNKVGIVPIKKVDKVEPLSTINISLTDCISTVI